MGNVIGNQRRVLAEFLGELRPHWRQDTSLPARIERLLRGDRRLGSRDRRLYRELIYTTLRYLNWIEPWLGATPAPFEGTPSARFAEEAIAWLAADLPATNAFRAGLLATPPPADPSARPTIAVERPPDAPTPIAAKGQEASVASAGGDAEKSSARPWPPCPATVQEKAAVLGQIASARLGGGPKELPGLLPSWAEAECPVALEPAEYDALHRRAPLWVRLQGDAIQNEEILREFTALGWPWRRSLLLDTAIRIDTEADVTATDAFKNGRCEIQDLGSQLILAAAVPAAGGTWLDACAGAGGKSLQLAQLLGPQGTVDVHDVRPDALAELDTRAARAHLSSRIRHVSVGGPHRNYDGVLVDAPCSGTGTWRRSPHLKAVTAMDQLDSSAELQLSLLAQFGFHVRPGGRLIYATCSLCSRENGQLAERFLSAQPSFRAESLPRPFRGRREGPGLLFTPASHDGDGFFVASFRRAP